MEFVTATPAGAGKIDNLRIQKRVCFGEEKPSVSALRGMRIVEYYLTADNIVPCHIYVASRQSFVYVFTHELGTFHIINKDGRSQEFFFIKTNPDSQVYRLMRFKPDNAMGNMKVEYFSNHDYNDTAYVFFGYTGIGCTETQLVDKSVSCCFC